MKAITLLHDGYKLSHSVRKHLSEQILLDLAFILTTTILLLFYSSTYHAPAPAVPLKGAVEVGLLQSQKHLHRLDSIAEETEFLLMPY